LCGVGFFVYYTKKEGKNKFGILIFLRGGKNAV